ncbi:prostaglandin E receptor 2a (subtype EP2) [Neosynchiropus ocellatus]
MGMDYNLCHDKEHIDPQMSPVLSATMFGAGIFGNVAALVILEIRRRREAKAKVIRQRSLFHVLITVLVITDLAGTCLVSPLVQLSYARNTTLVGMSSIEHKEVCMYFGVCMTFFSLATMSLLFTMALERCFAIGYPYMYSRYITYKCAYITIPVVFLVCAFFCLLPFTGFGIYVQYCPGTWCFIDMNPSQKEDRVYANLYATIMLVLVLVIVACNGFVICQLLRMYQRRKRNGGSVMGHSRSSNALRITSIAQEVNQLILLVFMTIIFIICTLPLVIRVYINSFVENYSESHPLDLIALRFISVNSILDPWVFILLSPSVLHFFWASVCRLPKQISRGSIFNASVTKDCSPTNVELSGPTQDYAEKFHPAQDL